MKFYSAHVLAASLLAFTSLPAGAVKRKVSHQAKKAPPKKSAPVAASKWVVEELTIASGKSKGCFMRYQRRHETSGYDANVGFNMMCCDYSKDQKCCPQNKADHGLGFERGCKPLVRAGQGQGPDTAWLTSAQVEKVQKRSCQVAGQCQVGGTALMAGGIFTFAAGAATFLGGNIMGGSACVGGGSVAAYAGLKAMTSRQAELKECAKITDIKFKPNTYVKLQKGNIHDSATLLRDTMHATLVAEAEGASVVEQGAHNLGIISSPERQGAQEFIEDQQKRTGSIIPNPNP